MRKHPFKVRSKSSWKIVHSDLLYQYPSDYGSVVIWALSLCCFLAVLSHICHVQGHHESLQVEGSQFLSPPIQSAQVADFGSTYFEDLPEQRFIHNLETRAAMRGSPRWVAPRDCEEGETRELCNGKYIYIHAIGREFTVQLLEECHTLSDGQICVDTFVRGDLVHIGCKLRNSQLP